MLQHPALRRLAALPLAAALVLTAAIAPEAHAAPPPLELNAKSAILLDFETGRVLFEQNADEVTAPASLTKMMTLHLAYKRIAEGNMSPDQKVDIRPEAWSANWEGSSLMFLEPGMNVTVKEIMEGIAIPSGNDASVAMAQHMAGTVDAFVMLMNQEAKDMGFKHMQFFDPAGLSAQNTITAREFAEFSRMYIQQHPQALAELHSVVEYSFPKPHNNAPNKNEQPIPQRNRNGLLGSFPGVDGLKTGFIGEESGYNIALTAKQGDMRLVAVILGVPGANEWEGSANREAAGMALLQWGFQNWETVKPSIPAVDPVRVWKGEGNEVALVAANNVILTVERGQGARLDKSVVKEESVIAPIAKGDKLGEVIFTVDGQEIHRVDLVAADDMPEGGFFKRLWDAIRLWVMGLLNRDKE